MIEINAHHEYFCFTLKFKISKDHGFTQYFLLPMRKRMKSRRKGISLIKEEERPKKMVAPIFPALGPPKEGLLCNPKKLNQVALNSWVGLKSKPFQIKDRQPASVNQSVILNTSSPQGFKLSEKIDSDSYSSLEVSTKNWCLFDQHLNKLIGFRQEKSREIASLTKIMTTYLAIQIIIRFQIPLDLKVKITSTAASMIGTTAQLKESTFVSIEDVLYGTMLPSGNDAAYTLAEYLGYFLSLKATTLKSDLECKSGILDLTRVNSTNIFVQQFISRMNQRASQLDLNTTRFSNPHGLQNALNVSSAKDILSLSIQASKIPLFRTIMSTVYHNYEVFEDQSLRKKIMKRWWNTNKLLEKDWEGVKTGQTTSAGGCLASLKNGIFIVVLNSSNSDTRFSDTEQIYRWYTELKKQPRVAPRIIKPSLSHKRTKTQFRYIETLTTEDSL